MGMQDTLFTRREFLKSAAIASAGATFLPSFLTQTASAATIPGRDEPVLVVIQLGGGNDGLNTVVPYANDEYHRARKNLALKKQDLLPLGDSLALNPGMETLAKLYEAGGLAIVNGVGYPNPDRSHFRSMEIWHTAVDSDRFSKTGWVGRFFDNCCGGRPDPLAGVHVGGELPQAFASKLGAGVAFQEPTQFRWIDGRAGDTVNAFETLNRAAAREGNQTVDYLRHVTATAVVSSDRVRRAAANKRSGYPGHRLARSLQHIAAMIAGGLPTRIYYTSVSGFDTHANQMGQQENLLRQFSESVTAFIKDLKSMGAADRIQVMCFSEFGRRVEENASRGTDHGTAGPVFMMGAAVKPGFHGMYPSLTDLDNGDLKHTVDFRAVYAEVLTKWMRVDSGKVVQGKFEAPGVVVA